MNNESPFVRCKHCGSIAVLLKDSGVPLVCCGEKMSRLQPNTADASHEKHVPVISVKDRTVTVDIGTAAHPMLTEHYIEWVGLELKRGAYYKPLFPGEAPRITFALSADDEVVAAFDYCNLHGLWRKEL
ncbi:MAG: desulfoferrodoxin [Clostridiales bacterium]|jgi:superoxide reductase|nr:desulfoferrodoxin [Clostridiales bacterium]